MAEQLLDREIETKAILEILNKSAENNKITKTSHTLNGLRTLKIQYFS